MYEKALLYIAFISINSISDKYALYITQFDNEINKYVYLFYVKYV